MAAPTPQVIAEWVADDATNSDYQPLRSVIAAVLASRLGDNSPEENAEIAEGLSLGVADELCNMIANELAEGVTASFELSTEGVTAYFRRLETQDRAALERLRGMDPTKFEDFCAKVLTALGATASATGGPHDGGVDFVGLNLQLGNIVHVAPKASHVVVVGQAKRYQEGNNIKLNDLRAFVGAAVLRVHELRLVSSSVLGVLTPVVYAYWTTSDFHYEAKRYARDMGMWYLNGVGLTQLAQRVGVGSFLEARETS